MKFFSKIQIFGVVLATLVALSLTACGESKGGGENKEQSKEESKEQNKEESKKENSQLSVYVKRECPQCVFVEEYRYETFDIGVLTRGWTRCLTADYYRSEGDSVKARKFDPFQVSFDKTFKIEKTIQVYKVRDDYQPEDKWKRRSYSELAITLLSMPEGVKKVAMSVNGSRLEDFTAPQQTQKVYGGDSFDEARLRTSALFDETNFCIKRRKVKQNNANETPNTQNADEAKASANEQSPANEQSSQSVELSETPSTQSADEAKASTNEQSRANEQNPASEQIKPSFDCAKASTSAEKLVCGDNELANLDNELSKAYANARNSLDDAGKKQLTSEQKAWLETYNQCVDKECVKQNLQKRIKILKSTDTRIYLATKDEFVNLRKSPNGEIITPIYKKDFDKIILKRLGVEGKWLKVLYFPPNVNDEKEALTGYIHNSQVR